jgi:hypothetical protein
VKDIKGKRFGRLLVLRYLYLKRGKAYWLCLCDCGNKTVVDGGNLKSGGTKSCGCLKIDRVRERSRAKLEGQRFGRLTVIKFSHIRNHKTYWKCKCDCGNITTVTADKLKGGYTKSCGCSHRSELKNQRFGRLTAIKFSHRENRRTYWKCKCDCGNVITVDACSLKSGCTKSCGCLQKETMSKRVGKASPNWKGGTTSESQLIRSSTEYKNWRDKIFEKDNYTCQMCGERGGKLQAHHKFPFSKFPRLRFAISNGVTLCEDCHNKIKWQEIHFK